jgi:hypothetical protein
VLVAGRHREMNSYDLLTMRSDLLIARNEFLLNSRDDAVNARDRDVHLPTIEVDDDDRDFISRECERKSPSIDIHSRGREMNSRGRELESRGREINWHDRVGPRNHFLWMRIDFLTNSHGLEFNARDPESASQALEMAAARRDAMTR